MDTLCIRRRVRCGGHRTASACHLEAVRIEHSVSVADDITRRAGIDEDSSAGAVNGITADRVVVGSAHGREGGQIYSALPAVAQSVAGHGVVIAADSDGISTASVHIVVAYGAIIRIGVSSEGIKRYTVGVVTKSVSGNDDVLDAHNIYSCGRQRSARVVNDRVLGNRCHDVIE